MPRPRMPERCWGCGAKATRYCDYILALPIVDYHDHAHRYPITTLEVDHPTCDRPLCAQCASWPTGVFLCGEDVDPLDYCAPHLAAWEREDPTPMLDEAGLAALRAQLAQQGPKHNVIPFPERGWPPRRR